MGKKRPPADPQQRFGDTSNVGSSTGWTDEKHMLYITSLEESFVNQLYSGDGEINSAKSFYRIPGVWQKTCSGNGRNTKYDQGQGYWGMVVADEVESRLSEVGYVGSPSCSGESPYYMADASSNGPRQERTSYHAGQMTSGGSAAFHLHQHGHSFYWRTESSDQNFIDGETEASREQGRGSSKNQRKHAGRPNWKRRSAIAGSWFRRPHHPLGKLRDQWDGPCNYVSCKFVRKM